MATLNLTQRNHATSRINVLAAEAIAKINSAYTVPAVRLTQEQQIALVEQGKVKVFRNAAAHYNNFKHFFDFSKFEKAEYLPEGWKKRVEEINALKATTVDYIMLGDSEAVLDALKVFENKVKELVEAPATIPAKKPAVKRVRTVKSAPK